MIRRLAAGLIVVGLAVGIWALWPDDEPGPVTTTTPTAAETTTTVLPSSTNTTAAPSTTTSTTNHVVATVEEAEAILRDLWFGWFEGIYNQDGARIREVVGTQSMLDAARAQFGVMEFERAPTSESIGISGLEILRSDEECLVLWATTDLQDFTNATTTDVHVLRRFNDQWVLFSLWQYRDDLWEMDCEGQLESL